MKNVACSSMRLLSQVLSHKVEHVLPVEAEHAPRAAARAVQPERGHAADHVARPDEVGPARIAEAGAPGGRVVREQQREIPHDAAVDLDQMRLGEHADLLGLDLYRVDLLQSLAPAGEQV